MHQQRGAAHKLVYEDVFTFSVTVLPECALAVHYRYADGRNQVSIASSAAVDLLQLDPVPTGVRSGAAGCEAAPGVPRDSMTGLFSATRRCSL